MLRSRRAPTFTFDARVSSKQTSITTCLSFQLVAAMSGVLRSESSKDHVARKSPRGCPLDSLVPCQFRLVFGPGIQSFFSVSLLVLRKYFLQFIGNDFLWRRLLAYSVTTTGHGALMAAISSHQEECLRTTSPANDGGNKDSTHSRERVYVSASQLEGGRESLGGGGGAGKGGTAWTWVWEK